VINGADGNGEPDRAARSQRDSDRPAPSANRLVEMREVPTAIGPTPDSENPGLPNAVREWCINTAAVNPPTNSIFTPSEDGHIYRWNLATNSLSQAVSLSPGVGEPYVPTVIGPDGTVYTLNGGTMFALGGLAGESVRLTSSAPDLRAAVPGQTLTFTAAVANTTGSGSYAHRYGFVSGYGVHSHGIDHDAARNRGPRCAPATRRTPLSPERRAAFHYCRVQR
jgi:hypothetical protein